MSKRTSRAFSKSRQGFGRNTLKGMGLTRPARSKGSRVVCKICSIHFAGKRWVHPPEARFALRGGPLAAKPPKQKDAPVGFTICPACRMAKDNAFEGEVVLRNFPVERKQNILGTVRSCGRRASARDPLERVLSIAETSREIRVRTSENQLAAHIGRELKKTFKGALSIRWSKKDEPVYVVWDGTPTQGK